MSSQRSNEAIVLDVVPATWAIQILSCGRRSLEATVPIHDVYLEVPSRGEVALLLDHTTIEFNEDGFILSFDQCSPRAIELKDGRSGAKTTLLTLNPSTCPCSPTLSEEGVIFDLRNHFRCGALLLF